MSCLGCSCRRSGHCAVIGLFWLLICPPCRLRALRVVVEPAVLLLGPWHRGWALLVVVGVTVSWLGSSRRCLARPVVLRPLGLSWYLPCGHSGVAGCSTTSVGVGRHDRRAETSHDFRRGSFDSLAGPPTSWVPPLVARSPPRFPALNGPTYLNRGEGHRGP